MSVWGGTGSGRGDRRGQQLTQLNVRQDMSEQVQRTSKLSRKPVTRTRPARGRPRVEKDSG